MSLSFLITLGITILFVAVTAGLFASNRSAKTLIGGLGLSLLPFGLYLLGITDLIVNGVKSLIDWAQRTYFDTVMTVGGGLLGAGLLLLLISAFIPTKPKTPRSERAADKGVTKPGPTPRAVDTGQPKAAAPKPGGKKTGQKSDAEDDEVEEILRRRGIM